MKVIEYRKPREGKRDKIWIEVKYSREEWASLLVIGVFYSAFLTLFLNLENEVSPIFVLVYVFLVFALCVLFFWGFLTLLVKMHARKKGTIVKRTE